jgi:long-chain acyl-CoA synthetase
MGGLILLTGATGFLGARIGRLILERTDHRLALLVRGRDEADARRRLERAWGGAAGSRVRVIRGDLSLPLLGLELPAYAELVCGLTHIIHAAAELRLDGSLEELRRSNVRGTARLLELARRVHADHGLKRFAHVSTAYVAGCRGGEVREDDLSDACGFSNAYERTKFEGERLVRRAMAELPVSVFRPGMVVGDSTSGEIRAFNTVYVPLRLYLTGKLKLIPAGPDLPVNIVPVDYVAGAVARLCFDPRAAGRTFHLTAPRKHLPRARDLLDAARGWAAQRLGEAPPQARFVPLPAAAGAAAARRLGLPASLLAYFSENRSYRRDNTDLLLGPYAPDWREILPRLLEYAVSRGFLHQSGRTVHEQLVRRLQSRRLPIRVHDLATGGVSRQRGGEEMCREIAAAAEALRALGIGRGDRVALVGLNSSRYLCLDTAIGLTGAVSVPLYYTAPAAEIDEILGASGARLLLVGAPEILARVEEIRSPVTIASFCQSPPPAAPAVAVGRAGRVLSWEEFLGLGAGAPPEAAAGRFAPEAPVGFPDIATLRFTSGTTGPPNGSAFRHGQLLWLAETVASLLPWKARTRPARYLSFLPMNHVVEGILGTYTPAYIPAPVDVYFLEDFHALARALPQVRPTVFFSVPRFYEKVWERFEAGPAGRLYLALPTRGPGGALRGTLRPLLRLSLLRRAGLDRCTQLIAGSAPCPRDMLADFRELGIEIHNAYGLTEAPLVTLNRRGANRLGTVGAPLPDTKVRLAADGEVLVRGPQVSTGHDGTAAEDILADGWLASGDLGEIDGEGNLIIRGRKKEILVTSYGKNIHPLKIEERLRRIPGLGEAMVIGDNKPSLSALLWLTEGSATPAVLKEIDRAVRRLNGGLSRPEQLKRWAVLAESPAIDSGELTGNLKLRRRVVLERRAETVAMLYGTPDRAPDGAPGREPLLPGVLHMGEAR